MKRMIFVLLGLLLGQVGAAQDIFPQPLSRRVVDYRIDIQLDTREKVVTGTEVLVWRNTSRQSVEFLPFHLYMNAFRNLNSTFLSERNLRHKRFGRIDPEKLGGIDIMNIQLADGRSLLDSIRFVQPDDENVHDSTVIRVNLPEPVQPGDSVQLRIEFREKLPRIIARTGYMKDFFLLGQWFPKIGVLEEDGWNCHQFHANSEFYADFGTYQVRITLPPEYVVGATGVLIREEKGDSLKTLTFRAEDVHDFALTAWPGYRKQTRQVEGTTVTLLYAPEHHAQVERYFQSITHALEYTAQVLFPYPYPNLTLVDPPMYAGAAMGMEYPCFITCGSIAFFPETFRLFPEGVTVHEFCHQYFYGMLASNEFEEPWLDEGFTSYMTNKIMEKYYGVHTSLFSLFGVQAGDYDEHKKSYMRYPNTDIIVKPAWEFRLGGYGTYAYDKSTLFLKTLEGYLGTETMNRVLREYVRRWKFRHPHTPDFLQVVRDVAPKEVDWLLEQALFTTRVLDYQVSRIREKKVSITSDSSVVQSEVVVRRNGEFIFPQKVQVVFSSGDTLQETWDGRERYRIFRYRRPDARVIAATVDPQQKVWLDVNWSNNSYTLQPNRAAFFRHWVKSVGLLQQILSGFYLF